MMPRIRTVKPEIFTHDILWQHEKLTGLPLIRAYIALWCMSDREARFEWKPMVLKQHCCPYDAIDFEQVLNCFANAGFVVKYAVGGRLFGWIPRFLTHQNINGREQGSRIPEPPRGAVAEHEARMLQFDFHRLTREQLMEPARVLGSAPAQGVAAPVDRRVEDASAVSGDASDTTGGGRQTELNRTEQNRTKGKGELLPPVAPAVPAATVDAGTAVMDAGASLEADAPPPAIVDAPAAPRQAVKALALPPVKGKAIAKNVLERFTVVLEEVRDGRRAQLRAEQLETLQAEFIITYWAMVFDKPRTLIDEKRRTRVRSRLKENQGDVNELLYAVDGAKRDPHLMGKNDRETVYDGISTIFRDREMVERQAGRMRKFVNGEQHKMLTKWKEIVAQESQ